MTDWNKLKVVDLKAELKKRGLPQTGLKPALVARLTAAENEDGSESEATIQGDTRKQDASSATSPDTVSPTQPSSDQRVNIPSNPPLPSTSKSKDEASVQATAPSAAHADIPATEQKGERPPPPSAGTRKSPEQANGLPSTHPENLTDDKNKRKRRSQSPPPTDTDIPRKRVRQDEIQSGAVDACPSNRVDLETGAHKSENTTEPDLGLEAALSPSTSKRAPRASDTVMEEAGIKSSSRRESRGSEISRESIAGEERPKDECGVEESPSRRHNSKFKDLFAAQTQAPPLEKAISRDAAPDAIETEPDHAITPAIHPATAALYIRDFMRPLNPAQLKNHLAILAAPPGRDLDPDVIVNFYLDTIRTHAFVSFTSVSAASRVRSLIHDRIWPEERTRKPLWADFVPVEKVEEWIEEESSVPGGRAMAKKWEIYYDVDEDRNVTAILRESSAVPRTEPARKPSDSSQQPPTPTHSRGIDAAPSGPRATQVEGQRAATSLSRLDELFNCTMAKPALYWKPVDNTLADRRLDNIDRATSANYVNNQGGGEINRYIFEDGDVVVDRGPEIFPGIRPPPRDGPRGGGPRGGGGGYRGRGGYGRGPERYDSYRSDMRDSRGGRRY